MYCKYLDNLLTCLNFKPNRWQEIFFCFVEYVECTVLNNITQTGLCSDRNRIVFLQELNCVLQELNCVLQEQDCVLTGTGLCFTGTGLCFDKNRIVFWQELDCVLQELDCVLTRTGLCFYKDWIVSDRNWIVFWGEKSPNKLPLVYLAAWCKSWPSGRLQSLSLGRWQSC